MGKIIAIANQKGGVGKTTTTINLGAALAKEGMKTLIVDLDEQANATIGLGIKRELVKFSTYDLLTSEADYVDGIYPTNSDNLNIIPSSNKLASIEKSLQEVKTKEQILLTKLSPLKEKYDYILLDCPPSLGVIIDNALFLCDSVIIPVECEYFAYDALTQMVQKINQIQKEKNNINNA